jgi:hypothetical protein
MFIVLLGFAVPKPVFMVEKSPEPATSSDFGRSRQRASDAQDFF